MSFTQDKARQNLGGGRDANPKELQKSSGVVWVTVNHARKRQVRGRGREKKKIDTLAYGHVASLQ